MFSTLSSSASGYLPGFGAARGAGGKKGDQSTHDPLAIPGRKSNSYGMGKREVDVDTKARVGAEVEQEE